MLRILVLLLVAIGGFAVDADQVLGLGPVPAAASVFPGGTPPANTQVVYSNGTTLAGDAGLTYTAAGNLLKVNRNAASLPAIPAANDTVIQVGGLDGTTARLLADTAGANAAFTGRRCDTSIAAPSALAISDTIVSLVAMGYGSTAYTTTARGVVAIQTTQAWTDANQGTQCIIQVTPNSTSTIATVASFSGTSTTLTATDAGTNNQAQVLNILHGTTGTAAAQFGTAIQYQAMDDGGTQRQLALAYAKWTDPASATRTSAYQINVANSAASFNVFTAAPTLTAIAITDAATASASVALTVSHATSGTAANGFGTIFQLQGVDDGATSRVMAQMVAKWTTAASGTRSSSLAFNVVNSTTTTLALTLGATFVTFSSGFPVTFSDTTASTSASTGAIITSGGIGAAKNITVTGTTGASFNVVTSTANGSVACVLTPASGPTGAATAVQGWVLVRVAGADHYVPYWDGEVVSPTWCDDMRDYCNGHPRSVTLAEYEESAVYAMDVQ